MWGGVVSDVSPVGERERARFRVVGEVSEAAAAAATRARRASPHAGGSVVGLVTGLWTDVGTVFPSLF